MSSAKAMDRRVYGKQFPCDWEAALYILLEANISLRSFIKLVLEERTRVETTPRDLPEREYWKFLLIRDRTLDSFRDLLNQTTHRRNPSPPPPPETPLSTYVQRPLKRATTTNLRLPQAELATLTQDDDDDQLPPYVGKSASHGIEDSSTAVRNSGSPPTSRLKRATQPTPPSDSSPVTASKLPKPNNPPSLSSTSIKAPTIDSSLPPTHQQTQQSNPIEAAIVSSSLNLTGSAQAQQTASPPPTTSAPGNTASTTVRRAPTSPAGSGNPSSLTSNAEGKTICAGCGSYGGRVIGRSPDKGQKRPVLYYCRNAKCSRPQEVRYIGWRNEAPERYANVAPGTELPPLPPPQRLDVTTREALKGLPVESMRGDLNRMWPDDIGRTVCMECGTEAIELIHETVRMYLCVNDNCGRAKRGAAGKVVGWYAMTIERIRTSQ